MTTFEKWSARTTYNDHDSHQQHAVLATAGDVMCMWTVASYDYAEQVLKAQRQFAHSMLAAAAPMLNVTRDVMSPDTKEGRSVNNPLDARSDQRHDDSNRSRKNERYNDDDTAEYNKRSADHNRSEANTSDTCRTERANTQAEESAKTRAPVAANTPERKLP
jgi:hypothetical protein